MRKIALVVLCVLLSGCGYYKQTLIRASGKNLSVPIGELFVPVKGEGVVISVYRQVFLMPKDKDIPKFMDFSIEDEAADKGKVNVGIK